MVRFPRSLLSMLPFWIALAAAPLTAQEPTSHLLVSVRDGEGHALPGVTLALTGLGASRQTVSDSNGEARFLRLDPGIGQVKATLDGYSTVERSDVRIRLGGDTSMRLEMLPKVEESMAVTDDAPLLDPTATAAGITLGRTELDLIPSTRNPWDLVTRTPGVLSDRIDVGGSESYDQFSRPRAPGSLNEENKVLLDGADVTDMGGLVGGGSFMFFDLAQVTDLELVTGGADVTKSTAGLAVNFVTKRGTNDFRGSARWEVTDRDGLFFFDRSQPGVSSADLAPGQDGFVADSVVKINQWGFEAGGPVVRDRLWFWGSYGQKDGSYQSAADTPEDAAPQASNFPYASFKANAQLTPATSALGSWNSSDRLESARDAGPTRPLPTAWSQRSPAGHLKLEETHIFTASFFLAGSYAKTDSGFELVPNSVRAQGNEAPQSYFDENGVWQGSYYIAALDTEIEQYQIDGSYFFNGGDVSHELKFGARLREFEERSAVSWSNDSTWSIGTPNASTPSFLIAERGGNPQGRQDYISAWVQDSIAFDRLTLSAGFRYDLQKGENLPLETAANAWFPELLPAISFAGAEAPFDWESISPRIGLTYALGEERRTLLRASFARFAQQLQSDPFFRLSPGTVSYATFLWYDTDGSGNYNGCAQCTRPGPDSVLLIGTSGIAATSLESPNRTDSGLDPETTDELLLALEHALRPDLAVSATVTVRQVRDILEERALVRDADGFERLVRREDFVLDGEITGSVPTTGAAYSVDAWSLTPELDYTGGSLLVNGDRERLYAGLGLAVTKRWADNWMARGYLQYGEAEWDVPEGFRAGQSPNRCEDDGSIGCNGAGGGNIDGGIFAPRSRSRATRDVLSQSTWQFNLNGAYRIAPDRPWGFTLAANVFGREGYPLPYYVEVDTADGARRDLLAFDELDRSRADDVFLIDLRLDKEFAASAGASLTVGIDVFNVFNETPVLQRERNLSVHQADWVREILGPRIWRLGVQLNWN